MSDGDADRAKLCKNPIISEHVTGRSKEADYCRFCEIAGVPRLVRIISDLEREVEDLKGMVDAMKKDANR